MNADPQRQIDMHALAMAQDAATTARTALALIEQHQTYCMERVEKDSASRLVLHTKLDRRLWAALAAAGSIIAALSGLNGFLIWELAQRM